MSIANNHHDERLEFTLGDRLGKAMRVANETRTSLAEYLGVSPSCARRLGP